MRRHHSTRGGFHAHSAAAILPIGDHTVSPRALGVIERLVGRFEHLFGRTLLDALGHADADGHRYAGGASAGAPLATLLIVLGTAVGITQLDSVRLDGLANNFQM